MNKRLQKLFQKKADLVAEGRKIIDLAEGEDRERTDEENSQVLDLEKKIDALDRDIEIETKLIEREKEVANAEFVKTKAKQVEVNDPEGFSSLGEQLQAVYKSTVDGVMDPRLVRAASGASEGIPSDGGFLVQTDFSRDMLKNVFETGQILSRVRKIPISANSNGLKINAIDETSRANGSRLGGVQAYWTNEAGSLTGSKPKFRQIELKLHKLTGLHYATDELLEDSVALEGVIRDGFQEEFEFKMEDSVIRGSGAGEPLGILSSGALVSVSKESGQSAATVVYENINKMWSRMLARNRANSVWLINQECEPQLNQMSLSVGTGGSAVYLPPGGLSTSPYSSLFGRPVIPVEYCSALGTVGDIMLVDLNQYLMITKGGVKADSSVHVRFIYDEMTFRFIVRVDGQPIPSSPITPYKGSSTLSPFVALATRS